MRLLVMALSIALGSAIALPVQAAEPDALDRIAQSEVCPADLRTYQRIPLTEACPDHQMTSTPDQLIQCRDDWLKDDARIARYNLFMQNCSAKLAAAAGEKAGKSGGRTKVWKQNGSRPSELLSLSPSLPTSVARGGRPDPVHQTDLLAADLHGRLHGEQEHARHRSGIAGAQGSVPVQLRHQPIACRSLPGHATPGCKHSERFFGGNHLTDSVAPVELADMAAAWQPPIGCHRPCLTWWYRDIEREFQIADTPASSRRIALGAVPDFDLERYPCHRRLGIMVFNPACELEDLIARELHVLQCDLVLGDHRRQVSLFLLALQIGRAEIP